MVQMTRTEALDLAEYAIGDFCYVGEDRYCYKCILTYHGVHICPFGRRREKKA